MMFSFISSTKRRFEFKQQPQDVKNIWKHQPVISETKHVILVGDIRINTTQQV